MIIIIIVAIFFFLFAATLGLTLLMEILCKSPAPQSAVKAHGLIAAGGLITFGIYIILGHFQTLLMISFILFIMAAMNGLTLFILRRHRKPLPTLLVLLHPLLAFSALILLVIDILP